MIAGHFFLAFSIVALLAYYIGKEGDDAVKLGLAAGLFALLPDIDILYAFKEIFAITSGFYGFTDSFWGASQETHRGMTHSLIFLAFAALGFISYHKTGKRLVAGGFILAMFGLSYFLEGPISAAVMLAFGLTGFIITDKLRNEVSLRDFKIVSLAGLLLHPFGDVFTGVPPDFFYPSGFEIIGERLVILQDPSFNFLAVFGIELFMIWTAIIVYVYVEEKHLIDEVSVLSVTGFIYGVFSFILTSPSLSQPYQFVFSIIMFSGLITALIWVFVNGRDREYFYALIDFFSIMFVAYLSYLILFVFG
jgi:hypothetical protein